MVASTRKRGRPRKPATPGERSALGLRVTPQIKEQLDGTARQHGRTQSQEAERRIELTFRAEDQFEQGLELIYGRQLGGLLTLLGHVIREAGRSAGFTSSNTLEGAEGWMSNPYAFDQAVEAANAVLEALRPVGDPSPTADLPKGQPFGPAGVDLGGLYRNLGVSMAGPYLAAIVDPEAAISADLHRFGADVAGKLGETVTARIKRNIDG
jgi:hypothetical protein